MAVLPFALGLSIDFFIASEFLFGRTQAVIAGIVALIVTMSFWYGLEVVQSRRYKRDVDKDKKMSTDKEKQSSGTKLKDKIEQVLTELRVALPGAQALLGFQFSALFMESFMKLPQSLKTIHFISLSLIGLTVIFLMTPAAYHRIVQQGEQTERFHRFASNILLTALVPLALGITGDFYVVTRKVTESRRVSLAPSVLTLLLFMVSGWVHRITSSATRDEKPSRCKR